MNLSTREGGSEEVVVINFSQGVKGAPRRRQLRHMCREDRMCNNSDQPLSSSDAER